MSKSQRYTSSMPEWVDRSSVVVRGSAAGFAQEVFAGLHRFTADEPVAGLISDRAGLVLASVVTVLQLRDEGLLALDDQVERHVDEVPHAGVTIRLRHSRIYAVDCEECETREGMLDRIERDIQFEGTLTGEQRSRLLEIADKCPVHRTLVSEINIRTRAV